MGTWFKKGLTSHLWPYDIFIQYLEWVSVDHQLIVNCSTRHLRHLYLLLYPLMQPNWAASISMSRFPHLHIQNIIVWEEGQGHSLSQCLARGKTLANLIMVASISLFVRWHVSSPWVISYFCQPNFEKYGRLCVQIVRVSVFCFVFTV